MTTLTAGGAMTPRLQAAVNEVYKSSQITLDVVGKAKSLVKFGRNPALASNTPALIWNHGPDQAFENVLSTNAITHIVSSDASDTETIEVEGHTISGTDLTFSVQTVTLTGQTPAALDPQLCQATRGANNQAGAVDLVGDVYVMEGTSVTAGVPDDPADVHLKISGAATRSRQQSQKAATSISANDYWLLTEWHGHMLGATSARVDLDIEKRATTSGVWLPTGIDMGLSVTGTTGSPTQLDPVVIISANHHVRVVGTASANNVECSVYFGGYLASIV